MSFDPTENDYIKLFNMSEMFSRKRLNKTGFTLSMIKHECDELQSCISKKITIDVVIKKYKFVVKKTHTDTHDYRPDIIEGCNFHFNGIVSN